MDEFRSITIISWRIDSMANLFEKKKRSPLYQLLFSVIFIALIALNNNEKLRTIPSAYISFRMVQIIFSMFLLVMGILLIIGTFKEKKNRTGTENFQILLVVFAMILLVYFTIDTALHTVTYFGKL